MMYFRKQQGYSLSYFFVELTTLVAVKEEAGVVAATAVPC